MAAPRQTCTDAFWTKHHRRISYLQQTAWMQDQLLVHALREVVFHTHTGNKVVSTSATLSSCDLGTAGSGKLGSIGAVEAAACARRRLG